jgi:hypothetical protein
MKRWPLGPAGTAREQAGTRDTAAKKLITETRNALFLNSSSAKGDVFVFSQALYSIRAKNRKRFLDFAVEADGVEDRAGDGDLRPSGARVLHPEAQEESRDAGIIRL